MARISMLVPDADLALIDSVAKPNRSAFIVRAARDAARAALRRRVDDEVARCLAETAADDAALADEFAGTVADGL